MRASWLSRGAGIVIGHLPTALVIASLLSGGSPDEPFSYVYVALCGGVVGLANFYLSFIRPWIIQKRKLTGERARFVSGFPLVGTLLVLVAVVLGFGAQGTALVALVVLAIDTGGPAWFVIATWKDSAMWDKKTLP